MWAAAAGLVCQGMWFVLGLCQQQHDALFGEQVNILPSLSPSSSLSATNSSRICQTMANSSPGSTAHRDPEPQLLNRCLNSLPELIRKPASRVGGSSACMHRVPV